MAFDIGAVVAKIKADVSDFQNGMKTAVSSASGFQDKLSALNKGALIVTGAITGVAVASLKFGEVAGKYESIKDAFGSMTEGMGISADELEKRVAEASGGTIDRLSTLQNATRALSLMGKGAFTDFGTDFEQMAALSKKAARATGQDVTFMFDSLITGMSRESKMILDNLGITVDLTQAKADYAEQLGKSVDELTIEESKAAVLQHTLGKLEENYGAVAVTSGGFAGAMQKLKATISDAQIEIGTALLPVLNDLVRELIPIVKDAIPKFVEGVKGLVDWFRNLSPEGKKIVMILVALAPIIAAVSGFILLMIPVVSGIVAGFGLLTSGIGFVIAAINPFTIALAAIIAAAILIYKNWDQIVALFELVKIKLGEFAEKASAIFEIIKEAFIAFYEAVVKPIIDKIIADFQKWWDAMTWFWNNIASPLLYLMSAIFARIFYEIFGVIKDNLQKSWDFWLAVFTLIWEWLKPWFEVLLQLFTNVWNWISDITFAAWRLIKKYIIDPITDALTTVKEYMDALFKIVKGTWEDVLANLEWLKDKIYNALVQPFEWAKNKIEEYAKKIKEAADYINPFHKDSPSLVENVERGVATIMDAYSKLGNFNPSLAGVAVAQNTSGPVYANIRVDMTGAIISDQYTADLMGEKIGDSIIRKLKTNVRF